MRPTELDETNKHQRLVGRGKFPTRSGDLRIGSELKYVVDILKPLVFFPFSNSRLQKGDYLEQFANFTTLEMILSSLAYVC